MNQETIPRLSEAAMRVLFEGPQHTANVYLFDDYALPPPPLRVYRALRPEPMRPALPALPLGIMEPKRKRRRLTVKTHVLAVEAARKARQKAQKQARKLGRKARSR